MSINNDFMALLNNEAKKLDFGPGYSEKAFFKSSGHDSLSALQARKDHELISLTFSTGERFYPAAQFQFPADPTLTVNGFKEVASMLAAAGAGSAYTLAWLMATEDSLYSHGPSALDHLRAGGNVNEVLVVLMLDMERWNIELNKIKNERSLITVR